MVRVKAELSAPRVLELVVPRFDDVGDITGSVPVALDLSASLDVQLVFWERSGVAKELECVNVEEGCPRCKFASFLRGLVILKRRGALHINGAYVIEGDFARLRLQIEGVNDIGAAAIEEFSFVQCHLQLQNTAHAGKTEKDKVAAAMRSRCHVVGCNLHKWKMSRTQVMTPERVNLTPTPVSAPSASSVPSSAHASRVARAPPSSSSPEKAVRSTPEIQEPAGEASSPSPSIAENDVECSGDRTIMEPAPSRKLNLRDVFDSLMTPIAAQTEMWSPHIPGLDLTLYEHQRRGLSWMMKREEATLWETTLRHPFSVPGRLRHASDHLLESEFGDTARDVCGGMLCDEPGLGKTITMLALILLTKGQSTSEMPVRVDAPTSNTASVQLRSSSRGPALQADSMVSSSACLIVVPDALVDHWEEQIEAHVVNQGLRTYVDKAVAGSLPESNRLARYDVVIVSFSRMAKEWKLHRPPSALEARRAPRFGFEDQPDRYLDGSIRGEVSSLLSIHWLRVIVDEGHKLGGRAPTQLMQMSRLLCAERRWVMTGTPSPNTLQSADLLYIHGLLVFLRNQPYGRPDGFAWSKAIARPFERNEPVGFHRLQHLLSRIMVRHTKDSIRDKLPRPIRHTVVVDPTPSEFKLYNAIAERVRANLVVTAIDVPAKAAKADASSSVHPKSLLNRKNHKDAGHIETALAFAFMGGYAVNWTMKSKHKIRTLEKLRECGVSESRVSAVVEYLSTADVYVKDVLQCKKTRCGDCGFERRILMVLPCGHLCCGYCVDDLKKEIDECRCNFCDEPYDEDECSYLQPTLTGEVTERGRQSTLRKLREHGVSDAKLARVAAYMDTLKPKPATECIGCHRQLHLLLILTCGHLSCPDCVEQRNQQAGPSCPLCHESFSRKGFRDLQPGIRSEALEDNDKPARRKKPRVVTVKKRKRAAPAPKKRAVNYKRDYWKIDSSKISYMAARIRELTEEFARERDRDLKVIIFSQFRESIWRAKVAFQQQDIPTADFIALINPRERIRNLEAFRSNPNVHVLLLSNMGSHGLDLSFVTHIFLLEEIWDKSVEMQVISRAHRMGAKRSVVVEQLWMRGTVECQLNSTNQQLFKSDHSTGSSESPQHQPTREEVQEASSADKNSFQQLKMHYILNSLRVLKDDVVGKEGEVRFSVRDESETIIRQGVHTISDSGEISTVSTLPNPPPRPPAAAACTRPSVSPQQGPASTTRASRKKPDPPQVIVIDDSSDDERSSGCDSDSEEKCEENSTVIPMSRQDPLIPVKQEPVHAPVIPVRKPAVVPVKLEPVYIEIKDEDTESE